MLRELYIKKEKIRKSMESLWSKRESGGDWTPEEKKSYDSLSEQARSLDTDIKLRGEYVETFKMSKDKEDQKFDRNLEDASLYKIIRHRVYEQTRDEKYKDDYGRVKEVLQETRKDAVKVKDGFLPIPDSALKTEKRTDITSGAGSGGSLVSTLVRPDLYQETLFEKTVIQESGVPMISGLEGDVKIPKALTSSGFAFVAENSNFPEQDQTFGDITLQPKYAGGIQVFSLALFLRSQNESVMRFVQSEMLSAIRTGIDKAFINGTGASDTPKGLRQIIADHSSGANSIEPSDLKSSKKTGLCRWQDLLNAEGKITDGQEMMPLTCLIPDKLRRLASQILRFSVNGAMPLFYKNMLGDSKTLITNSVPTGLKVPAADKADYDSSIKADDDASGGTDLSTVLFFNPKRFLIGRWQGLQIQVNTQGESFWRAGKTAIRVIDVCNFVSRRPESASEVKNILNFKAQ